MFNNYFNTKEAAYLAGMTTGRLRQMIREGLVEAIKVNERAWLVPRKEVERLARQPYTRGRPRISQR